LARGIWTIRNVLDGGYKINMKEIYKGWQEFWAEFFRIKHRHSIKGIRKWDKQLVTHIISVLDLERESKILDLACGEGDKALEFARRGMSVVGIDIAKVLVDYGNEVAKCENLPVELIQGDMREVKFTNEFDASVILSGSFGFFEDEDNLKVLQVIEKALKPKAKFYIHGPNPLKKMREKWKGWDKVEGGYVLMKSDYNPNTGKTIDGFFYINSSGELIKFKPKPEDKDFSIETKLYTLNEMIKLIESANLKFRSSYGSIQLPLEEYRINSDSMIIVGEKP
jgi:SAM-dependent methyltransferase